MSYIAVGGAAASLVGGLIGSSKANKAARKAAEEKRRLGLELNRLENSRQAVINPYSGVTNLSSLAKDTSGMLSNTFANLSVATKAAEMQIEEADLSLANTLDTLRETGSSAGGATALAQAALKSKQGVTASIEQQESQNEKLKAEGEQTLQRAKMSEAQRLQNVQMSEGQRMQEADAAGKQFMFNATEIRENQKMSRVAGQMDNAAAQEAQSRGAANSALAAGFSGAASGLISAGGSAAKQGLSIFGKAGGAVGGAVGKAAAGAGAQVAAGAVSNATGATLNSNPAADIDPWDPAYDKASPW